MSTIADWLEHHGLGKYIDAFAQNDIDIDIVEQLSDAELKDLGVSLGDRKRLRNAIDGLSGAGHAPSARAAPQPGAGGAERRQLTVMFCDLVGSVALAERTELEDFRDLLEDFRSRTVAAVESHGGYVARHQGDGVLVYFGYPAADERDAERAVKAGLAIIAAMTGSNDRSGEPLAARVGIATGPTVVGDALDSGSGIEFAALGATPNLAARLQGQAAPGEVVIASATARLVEGVFDLEASEPAQLKGIAEPVIAHRVRGERAQRDSRPSGAAGRTPLIGRSAELALVLDRWDKAVRGSGQAVAISAEPGVGKSRLVREVETRLRAQPKRTITLQCSPYHVDAALYPVASALRAIVDTRDDGAGPLRTLTVWISELGLSPAHLLPVLAPLLSIDVPDAGADAQHSPGDARRRTLNALSDVVDTITRHGPVLLVAEDLHWSDPTTIDLIERLLERCRHQPLLAVLTHRPEFSLPWGTHANVTSVALNNLTRDEALTLLGRLHDVAHLPAAMLETIAERTDGVPLFIEELALSVAEAPSAGSGTAVPVTLRDALAARLDRLGRAREIAQLASVIGRQFSDELLGVLLDDPGPQLGVSLEALLSSGLVSRCRVGAAEGYEFKHALVRDTAYQSLLKRRRRELHARLLEHLEQVGGGHNEAQLELMVRHAYAAENWERALELAHRAGTRASSRGANAEAVAQLDMGLDAASRLEPTETVQRTALELRCELRAPLHALGRQDRLAGELELAREQAAAIGDIARQTQLRIFHSNLLRFRGQVDAALAMAREAAETAMQRGDRALAVSAAIDLSQAERVSGEFEQCVLTCQRGLELIRPGEEGVAFGRPVPAWVMLGHIMNLARVELGDFQRAVEGGRELISVADRLGHAYARVVARKPEALVQMWTGNLDDASATFETILQITRAAQLRIFMYSTLGEWAQIRLLQERAQEALDISQQGLAIEREVGHGLYRAKYLVNQGWALHRLGEEDRAEPALREAIAIAPGRDVASEVWCGFVTGRLTGDTDVLEGALRKAERHRMEPMAALCALGLAEHGGEAGLDHATARLKRAGMQFWSTSSALRPPVT